MKLFKNLRLTFCKKNKGRYCSNVVFTDESSFQIHSPGVCRWVLKGKNTIVVKEK